jgi:hypothetical protein
VLLGATFQKTVPFALYWYSCLFLCLLSTARSALILYSVDERKINEYRTFDGMRIGRGNWSTRRTSAPVTFVPSSVTNTRDNATQLSHKSRNNTSAAGNRNPRVRSRYSAHLHLYGPRMKKTRNVEAYLIQRSSGWRISLKQTLDKQEE